MHLAPLHPPAIMYMDIYIETVRADVASLHSSLQRIWISTSPHIQCRCCFPSFITAAHQDIFIPNIQHRCCFHSVITTAHLDIYIHTHSTQMLLSFIHHCSAPGYLYPHTFNTDVAFLRSSLQRTRIFISTDIQHRCRFPLFTTTAHQNIYIPTLSTQVLLSSVYCYGAPAYSHPHI